MSALATLGIDPGRSSGWALLIDGRVVGIRTATPREVTHAVGVIMELCAGAHLVVVGERWQGGWRRDRGSARTVAGLGAAWGRWEGALLGAGHPARRILRVGTSRWRADVIGGRCARKTAAWKAAAKAWAEATYGERAAGLEDDEADALAIAYWGSKSPQVAALRSKR